MTTNNIYVIIAAGPKTESLLNTGIKYLFGRAENPTHIHVYIGISRFCNKQLLMDSLPDVVLKYNQICYIDCTEHRVQGSPNHGYILDKIIASIPLESDSDVIVACDSDMFIEKTHNVIKITTTPDMVNLLHLPVGRMCRKDTGFSLIEKIGRSDPHYVF